MELSVDLGYKVKKQAPKKKKRVGLKIFIGVLGFIILMIAVMLLLITRTPDTYQPLEPIDTEQVNPYITHYLAPEVYNNIQTDRPFCVIVDQKGINEIIVDGSLGWEWPADLGVVKISAPSLTFTQEEILLMGTVNMGKLPIVVTISLAPRLDDEGLLHLNFEKVKAGSLDISFLAKKITGQVIANEMQGQKFDHYNGWVKDIRDAVAENKPFDPVWPVYEKAIRLIEMQLSDQRLRLVFEPKQVEHE